MTTLHLRKSHGRSPWRRGYLLTAVALACFALSPTVRAVLPAPDGGYPGLNTAEGDSALFSLTTGTSNTAIGNQALYGVTTSNANTALGDSALFTLTDAGIAGAGENVAIGAGALYSTNSYQNTAIGVDALYNDTTGVNNIAIGPAALFSDTTGDSNVAIGFDALYYNLASNNTAMGTLALYANSTGSDNTANGFQALEFNSTGSDNTANGLQALHTNTTGTGNTANGSQALLNNTTGSDNTAIGFEALNLNTTADVNTAIGWQALQNNTSVANTAIGGQALDFNTGGFNSTAIGYRALYSNTTGGENTAEGFQAASSNTTGFGNTVIGVDALQYNNGSYNIALGHHAGINLTTGDNNIDIGNFGVAAEANTIRIGTQGTQTATFVAGIRGVVITGAQAVGVNANGQLGVRASSARFKEAIKPMDKASEAILSLQPVTFRYKKELDPKGATQFGLVAEEVAKVNADLVMMDEQGKPFTVRYDEVNAMLLNEFLKEHRTVQALKSAAAKQEATIAHQQKQIEALGAAIQKVSAQVEMSRPAPQTVVDNH